jgi:hypothetical protein
MEKAFEVAGYDTRARAILGLLVERCTEVELAIHSIEPNRARSLALTKLEETAMWAQKAVQDEQRERVGKAG